MADANRMRISETPMNTPPFSCINHTCDDALHWINEQLTQAGLHSVQTFDLNTARVGLHNCPCPNHGMEACDCQMVILLIYGKSEEPVTLILHGNDGQTWLSIAETIASPTTDTLTDHIISTLSEKQLFDTSNYV
jgi:hypothetical protein